MSAPRHGRVYKELTLQQLRSFCETARLGTLSGAAAALGLAPPTVWAQVHALERQLGKQLVETTGGGCRLTQAGRLLAEMAGALVAGVADLPRRFQEAQAEVKTRLSVATFLRTAMEDLPPALLAYQRRYPDVWFSLKEKQFQEEILQAVESRQADVGLCWANLEVIQRPLLHFEPCYSLDYLLVTPKDHPLARRRVVRPCDLQGFPLVNATDAFRDRDAPGDVIIQSELRKYRVFEAQPRRVEVYFAASIRRYVELGFGIGIVAGRADPSPAARLHERSMSRYFGRLPIYSVWRRRPAPTEPAAAFINLVKEQLGSAKKA